MVTVFMSVAYCVLTDMTVAAAQLELEVLIGEMVPALALDVEFMLNEVV